MWCPGCETPMEAVKNKAGEIVFWICRRCNQKVRA